MTLDIFENGIFLQIYVTEDGDVRLANFSRHQVQAETATRWQRLVEVQLAGMNQNDHHGSKRTGTQPGMLLTYESHSDTREDAGRNIEIVQSNAQVRVTSRIRFYDGIAVVRCETEVENIGTEMETLEYVSSFAYTGLTQHSALQKENASFVHIPHSTWYGEAQWKRYTPAMLGYDPWNTFSMKRIALSSTGTWPASEYLPMGAFENEAAQECMLWQIETAGSWNSEISDIDGAFYVQLSGPSASENQFAKHLAPHDRFCSVPCAVTLSTDFEQSVQEMTRYRRAIRRENEDNEHPTVIFNDYMNCLFGDPTSEKLIPLIDAAADAGCDVFCVDCGWYDDGPWWDGVGEWLPAKGRFPEGIQFVMDYIRKKGMVPGLWLELEVMGIDCPLVDKVANDWFFQRNGRRVIDHSRYQLDFRNPEVRAHATSVVRRLVEAYGVGYIKNDYNIDAGVGTELQADTAGEGLLAHTRAYLAWLDEIFAAYPDLVIENCGSGGMRMEYSLLQRHSIQSVTDQTDYMKMAPIACNCMSALTPEQAAIWSYPLREGNEEETIFNMVSAMLLRVHQSGHLAELSASRLAIVREGIAYHKHIVSQTKQGLPFWPIGLASMQSEFLAVGLDCSDTLHLAVWCCGATGGYVDLPIQAARGKCAKISSTFPSAQTAHTNCRYFDEAQVLRIYLGPKTARVITLTLSD